MRHDLIDDLVAQEFCREVCMLVHNGWDFDKAWHMSQDQRALAIGAIAQVLLLRIKD
jgi:hypothetical protein